MAPTFDWVLEKIESAGKDARRSGNEIVLDCPYCGDRKKHLYFNTTKGVWTCFRCNESGRVSKLFRELGIPLNGVEPKRRRKTAIQPEPEVWPETRDFGTDALQYLAGRNCLQKEIALWQMRQGTDRYEDYVFFPVLDKSGSRVGMHGRRFRYSGSKALNFPRGADKGILGMHLIPELNPKELVVVEGPYDATHVTRELMPDRMLGLALMGHGMTPLQMLQLSSVNLPVYLMLDGDAWESCKQMQRTFSRWSPCKAVRLLRGDPDEHGRKELLETIRQ